MSDRPTRPPRGAPNERTQKMRQLGAELRESERKMRALPPEDSAPEFEHDELTTLSRVPSDASDLTRTGLSFLLAVPPEDRPRVLLALIAATVFLAVAVVVAIVWRQELLGALVALVSG